MVILEVSGSRHGTVARYNHQKCRCEDCRRANRYYQSRRRTKRYLICELEPAIRGASGDDAATLHRSVERGLEDIGYHCETEVPIRYDGGRAGRIDLVASRDGITVAIEIDRSSPRVKSVAKLNAFGCDVRLIVLRTPRKGIDVPNGIDGVIECQ